MGRFRFRGRGMGRGEPRGGGVGQGRGQIRSLEYDRNDGGGEEESPSRGIGRGRGGGRSHGLRGRGIGAGRGNPAGSAAAQSSTTGDFDRPFPSLRRRNNRNRNRNRSKRCRGRFVATVEREMLAAARRCSVCKKDDAPYRCPTCLKKYCSVSCCKTHKASSKCVPLKSTISQGCTVDMDIVSSRRKSSVPKQYLYPTVDTIRPEGLAMLNQPPLRDTMLMMFKSKNLREKIVAIDSSGDKTTDLFESFMKDKEFAKFSSFVVDALSDQFMDELNKDFVKLKVQKHS